MKLVIKNLGSLQHAEIDLSKRFYLFTGYNNTGKTYVTKLLYQIFQKENYLGSSPSLGSDFFASDGTVELTKEILTQLLNEYADYLKRELIDMLKIKSDSPIIQKFHLHFEYNEETFFASEINSTIDYNIDNTRKISIVLFEKPKNSFTAQLKEIDKTPTAIHENLRLIYNGVEMEDAQLDDISKKISDTLPKARHLSQSKAGYIIVSSVIQNLERGFFLPANRAFLLENANDFLVLKNKRNEESFNEALEEENGSITARFYDILEEKRKKNSYTKDIDILLDKIAKLRINQNNDFVRQGISHYDAYLQKMQDIMGGEIVMEKLSSMSNWTEKFKMQGADNEESINLYLASSSANQLALLFQFFKYWAKKEQNFLMIDEPEINLHPENQIKLVNMLLSFVGEREKNNRLLLTTHSPMIAEMISNYLNLSFLKKQDIAISEELEDMSYFHTKITLNEEEVGIYAFHGDNVEEYKRQDYGIVYKNINKEVNKVANIASYLTDSIYQLENA